MNAICLPMVTFTNQTSESILGVDSHRQIWDYFVIGNLQGGKIQISQF